MNDITSLDPRFLYEKMRLEGIKEKVENADKKDPAFQKKLDKEIEKKKLIEVSEQLESIFVNMMFKSMRQNLNKNRLLPENPAENIFSDMLYQEYSVKLAHSKKFGFAKMIYDQYSKYI